MSLQRPKRLHSDEGLDKIKTFSINADCIFRFAPLTQTIVWDLIHVIIPFKGAEYDLWSTGFSRISRSIPGYYEYLKFCIRVEVHCLQLS